MSHRDCLTFCTILLLTLISIGKRPVNSQDNTWVQVDEGLFVGEFLADKQSIVGNSRITVIKIDPNKYSFRLLCASELNHPNLTVDKWCRKYGLIAATNAGMFQTNYKSNVGYMKNFGHISNPRISRQYYSVAAFNPIDSAKPRFRIYDLDEENMEEIIQSYSTVIQNLRLIKRPGINRWSQQDRKWSEAALGEDRSGNVLFIFSRSPYSMHDFVNILLRLPIDIVCAQHLEGGPEASLNFSHNNMEIRCFGSYESGFNETDENDHFWPIPNVIGIVRRTQ